MSGELDFNVVNNLENALNEKFSIENVLIDLPEMKSQSSMIETGHEKRFSNQNVTMSQRIEGLVSLAYTIKLIKTNKIFRSDYQSTQVVKRNKFQFQQMKLLNHIYSDADDSRNCFVRIESRRDSNGSTIP